MRTCPTVGNVLGAARKEKMLNIRYFNAFTVKFFWHIFPFSYILPVIFVAPPFPSKAKVH